jgi:hypothetical protein
MPGVKEDFDAIPHELQNRAQWLIWKKRKRGGKVTKVPYQSNNPRRNAAVNKSETWSTFDDAVAAYHRGECSGIGFVLTDDDPYCFIDFDNICVNGKINTFARGVIKKLNSYTEWSPSGEGAHVIGLASLGRQEAHKTDNSPVGGGIEIYDRLRYFCFTGHRIRGTNTSINRFDPAPIIKAIKKGNNGRPDVAYGQDRIPGVSQAPERKRHPALVALGSQLLARGTPRDVVEESLRSLAVQIDLPSRERDEVGRIVEWLFQDAGEENQIARGLRQKRIRREIDRRDFIETTGNLANTASIINIGEDLKEKDDDVVYTVDQLMPVDSTVLLSAERKAGKTVLLLNLVKSLLDGEPFLNYFDVNPEPGSVMYLNYELSRTQFKRWVRPMEFAHPDRFLAMHMVGDTLPFWMPDVRDEFVESLVDNNVWCLIIDTQILAAYGIVDNENDNMQWAGFHRALEGIMKSAGLRNIVLAHHLGKVDSNRARGASRIEDWAGAMWYLKSIGGAERDARVFSALGRDVDTSPLGNISLSFDRDSRRYWWDGSTVAEDQSEARMKDFLISTLALHESLGDWPSTARAKREIKGTNKVRLELIARAVSMGFIVQSSVGTRKSVSVTDSGRGYVGR